MAKPIKISTAQQEEFDRRLEKLFVRQIPDLGWVIRRPQGVEDFQKMRELQIETFGTEYVNTDDTDALPMILELDALNPLAWRLLFDAQNKCIGFYCQFLLHPKSFANLKSGKLKEHHIQSRHVRGIELNRSQIIHITDIVAHPNNRKTIAKILLLDLMHLHKHLVQNGVKAEIISAIAATPDGLRLCESAGMLKTNTFPKDHKNFQPCFFELQQNNNPEQGISRIASIYINTKVQKTTTNTTKENDENLDRNSTLF
jgi:hypothetical protein